MKTASLTLTALFAAASVSFAQATSPTNPPMTAASPSATNPPVTASSPRNPSTAATTPSPNPPSTTTNSAPSADEMKQMMELAKLNENHKLLASLAGTWSYTVTMWMAPGAPPSKSTGTAVRKSVMEGRYLTGDYTGKFKMPGADGKMKETNFQGMSMDAYDNVKKKFISGWVDNMGTGIMISEGTYDAATKTFSYTGEYEGMPGVKSKVREVIKTPDKDHMTMEYYEDRGQGEMKGMEIAYTRKK